MGGQSHKGRRSGWVGRVGRERELAALAYRQHGVIARWQLRNLGVGGRSIDRRLEAGRLHMLHRGVYALGHARVSQRGRWLAAVLAHGENAILGHETAAALWGLASQRGSRIDVISRKGRGGRRTGIRLHHIAFHQKDRTVRDGIPVTTVARTLFDLAEVVDGARLARVWKEADRLNLLELRALEAICRRTPGRRSLRPVRRLLAETQAPEIVNSALEERFAVFCHSEGLPPPVTNVDVLGYEVDALWPKQRLVVELDGYAFHRHRAAFERDRARDAALLAAGYRVARITHRRLTEEGPAVARELGRLLEANG